MMINIVTVMSGFLLSIGALFNISSQANLTKIIPAIETKNAPPAALPAHNTYEVWVTAYTSTPKETDTTPFITASGTRVHDGIIAANFLPFGARVQIPELYGNQVFVVEDRMHKRKRDSVDIWMPSKKQALAFDRIRSRIIVLN